MGKSIIYKVFEGTDREFTGNIKEIAEHFNRPYKTLCKHNKNIKELENYISKENSKRNYKYLVFKGKDNEFEGTIKEIVNHFNLNENTFYARLYKGIDIEDIIENNIPKIRKDSIYTVYEGKDNEFTGSLRQICIHFNKNYEKIKGRIRFNQNISIEEALDVPSEKVMNKILKYKDFKGNLKEICKHFNKNYIEVYNKMRYNYSLKWSIESTIEPYIEE